MSAPATPAPSTRITATDRFFILNRIWTPRRFVFGKRRNRPVSFLLQNGGASYPRGLCHKVTVCRLLEICNAGFRVTRMNEGTIDRAALVTAGMEALRRGEAARA